MLKHMRLSPLLRRALFSLIAILSLIGLAALVVVLRLQFHPALADPPAVPVASAVKTSPQPQTPEELYLDLMKKVLTRAQMAGRYEYHALNPRTMTDALTLRLARPLLHDRGFELVQLRASDAEAYMKAGGANLSRLEDGETMVGLRQLDNVQFCVTDVLRHKVPGDLIEAGAWRGGITIFMRAILKAYGNTDRKVWVADSFEGLPPIDQAKNPGGFWRERQMAVSIDEVRENFAGYGLLDVRVRFLKGFFNKTLPGAPIEKLAVFRADADLYESTLDALNNLYPKLSVGGYAIFDDYMQIPGCKRAIDEYRASHGITEPIHQIDGQAIYWQRAK
jgi:O-methyltransferase